MRLATLALCLLACEQTVGLDKARGQIVVGNEDLNPVVVLLTDGVEGGEPPPPWP